MTDPAPRPAAPRPTLGLTRRALAIGCVLAHHGARTGTRLAVARLRRGGRHDAAIAGACLAEALEALGPTFVKLGQLLSTRADLLPPALLAPLQRLQDHVRPFDPARVPGIVERCFGRTLGDLFETFDARPVSSASIAQVHRARLRGCGREVAVKIRRPGIASVIERDLALLLVAADRLGDHPSLRRYPVRLALAQFSEAMRGQLDFVREAEANRRLRRHFQDTPAVRIPALVDELCCEDIITMDFLGDIARLDSPRLDPAHAFSAVRHAVRALYAMLFRFGLLHCDLHPGNLFAHGDGDLTILDTGFMAELEADDVEDFRSFFLGVAFNDGPRCARILLRTALWRGDGFDADAFQREVVALISRYSGLKTREFSVAGFVRDLFDVQRRHAMCGSPNFTLAILSLFVLEGLARVHAADLDFQGEARAYLGWMLLAANAP